MQFFLMIGLMEGNYGGTVDVINSGLFQAFRKQLWVDVSITWSEEFDMAWKAATWGKFEILDYAPSPLQEHYIEFGILFIIFIIYLISICIPILNKYMVHMRLNAAFAFLLPLILSSSYCLTAIIYIRMTDVFAFISLITSISIFVFYLFEILNCLSACLGNKFTVKDGKYSELDIDSTNSYIIKAINGWELIIYTAVSVAFGCLGSMFAGSVFVLLVFCLFYLGFTIASFCYGKIGQT
jgi:hypothetical protein